MSNIKTRWAPSPTGDPHIGGIRTALFNFLFAKNQKGDFLLRIEDTDQKRLIPKSIVKIKESLEVLGLKWDNYSVQSERLAIYEKHLEQLKKMGVVYQDEGAWRFKVEKGKKLSWVDGVHGKVQFLSDVIEDFVIVKSDKFPTYHFANVIDDTQFKISHVLRGDEWLSSTPKHLMLYEAFGWQPPMFVHIPVILGADHKKLSEREGAKSVTDYIDEGYLPQAIINFLALLGWAPKSNQEIFSAQELIREFSLDRINKNSPIFNVEKLNWFNGQWIRRLDPKMFNDKIQENFPNTYSPKTTIDIAPLVQSRLTTIADFPSIADGFYKKPNLTSKVTKAVPLPASTVSQYARKLEDIDNWSSDNVRAETATFAEENNLQTKDIYRSLGVATFGSLVTPPLPESVTIIGKDKTIERLDDLAKNKKQAKAKSS